MAQSKVYNIISPQKINCNINLPASKSISNRALIISALAGAEVLPTNIAHCDDTDVMLRALDRMPHTIDIGAAGTAMRFLCSYLSIADGEHIITGSERMKQRPIAVLVDALRMLGADIEYIEQEAYPPLRIRGKQLIGKTIDIRGNVSSQYISALLMIAPMLQEGIKLRLIGEIVSRPYIDMTLAIMKHYAAECYWQDGQTICVLPSSYKPKSYDIEADWSAASYWYEIIALSNDNDVEVCLQGLTSDSLQGDSIVKDIFEMLGVATLFDAINNKVVLTKTNKCVDELQYDFSECPDLAQTVVCSCCALGVKFCFTGLSTLRIKETDRLSALQKELLKLGYEIEIVGDDCLCWNGKIVERQHSTIATYHDHRMAMAFAPMTLRVGDVAIAEPDVVSKSYPNYWQDLQKVGFIIC